MDINETLTANEMKELLFATGMFEEFPQSQDFPDMDGKLIVQTKAKQDNLPLAIVGMNEGATLGVFIERLAESAALIGAAQARITLASEKIISSKN